MERLVVVGASGRVGREIARLGVAYGLDVIGVTRSGEAPNREPWTHGVTWTAGDAARTDWATAAAGATAIVVSIPDDSDFGGAETIAANLDVQVVVVGCASHSVATTTARSVHLLLPPFDDRAERGEVGPSSEGIAVSHGAMAALRVALEGDHQGVVAPEEVAHLGDAMFFQ